MKKQTPNRTHAYAGQGEYRVPKAKNPPPLPPELAALAVEHLGEAFTVLEARGSDRLDFHDASVVGVRDLIWAAFEAGRKSAEAK